MLHYLWPGAVNQTVGLGQELLTSPGGAVALDSGREWVAAASGSFLAGEHVLGHYCVPIVDFCMNFAGLFAPQCLQL